MTTTMRHIALPAGDLIPVLGQGTGHMAERPERREDEIAALRTGIDLGMTLIDTAEMYADGGAETLVGEAIAGRRDEVFVVSKVLPRNATRRGAIAACEASLHRLNTDHLDLYLLHWRGSVSMPQTIDAFLELQERGSIRHWGVSNFDVADLAELWDDLRGPDAQTDQVLYNLSRRGPEHNLLPWCREQGLTVMAYSPMEQGRILGHPALRAVADRHGATPAQVALAWVLLQPGVCTIPKSGSQERVREDAGALELKLGGDDLDELDRAFPRSTEAEPLEML